MFIREVWEVVGGKILELGDVFFCEIIFILYLIDVLERCDEMNKLLR